LLRRSTSAATKIETEPEEAHHPEVVEVRPGAGRPGDRRQTERRQAERRQEERRQGDRRGMEALRAEALANVISMVEDRNFGGLRNRISGSRGMPMSRILLLVVALCAGGVAAFLATQHEGPAQAATAEVPVAAAPAPTTRVLVAKADIGIGQRLSAAALEWTDWPDAQLRDDYITAAAAPDAIADMTGEVVRADFFAGEPIRTQKLAPASGGYLSAVLEKGKRGVSVTVNQESASGGFVVPNDHVDVVLTRQSDTGPQDSQVILTDVRVLAINARLGATSAGDGTSAESPEDATSQVFSDHAIATLELGPAQAQVIINATTLGRLSLMLRPVDDNAAAVSPAEQAANAAIRMSSPFWTK
jgi:pilus assembly protein CpaB